MSGRLHAAWWSLLVACSVSAGEEAVEPLAALPPPSPAETQRFRDAEACAQCHLAGDDTAVLHDASGRNVSPVLLWRSSMMGLAARDPFYLAVFSEELARDPDERDEIEAQCTRCHAPAGSEELATSGRHVTFDELTAGTSVAATLGRGGVTCTLCHQIAAASLEGDSAFTGAFTVGYSRKLFGPYNNPLTMPMQLIVDYEPTYGAHIAQSALCGSCHTVILPTPSGEIVEQATYLEWRASDFARQGTSCQVCHVATVDESGTAITAPVASFPSTLGPRQPVGRHVFVGGNSYMLRLLADAWEWSGAGVPPDELAAAAARTDAALATSATLTTRDLRREGDTIVFVARVENEVGHKLPTGYPSRRLWLHVTATTPAGRVFDSGVVDARGALVDAAGRELPVQPHHDVIASPDHVQVWEAQLVDIAGNATHRARDARRYAKDNRILPRGFAPTASDRARTEIAGVIADASFVPGSDEVTYRIAAPAGATIEVELLYQSLRPDLVDKLDAANTPAAARFVSLARDRPMTPVVLARTSLVAP
jgi:hypothetical protein